MEQAMENDIPIHRHCLPVTDGYTQDKAVRNRIL